MEADELTSRLFANNQAWAAKCRERDPHYFSRLVAQQKPDLLWIGCSDSRVPANQIIDLEPGRVFVHRNIANVVIHTDLNCLSVLQYAVDVLGVRHVVVCGHYGCGGVKAALEDREHGLIDNWLRHIRDVRRLHREKFENLSLEAQVNLLCELNVREQVINAASTTIVRSAWARGAELTVSGWIYRLTDGILRDLGVSIAGPDDLPDQSASAASTARRS